MKVGDIEITPMSDGFVRMPSTYFNNADWSVHKDLLDDDDAFTVPIGSFLIRTGGKNVLIDAGIGPVDFGFAKGGELPGHLEAAGVAPSEVDIVLCTHLHQDHMGWLVNEGTPFFPNATVKFRTEDWTHFVTEAPNDELVRPRMETLRAGGRVELLEADSTVADGIDTLHSPGHTPGHSCVVISSGEERVFLLGDSVFCPVQLEEPEWEAISDVDPKLAKRTRDSLWKELETSGDATVGAHFPELEFGRVMKGEGKRFFS